MPRHVARSGRAAGYLAATALAVAVLVLVAGPRAIVSSAASLVASWQSPGPAAEPPATTPSGPYRVVGLGDSIPAGSVCGCTSYVSLVAQDEAARRSRTADVANLAQGGLTTTGLLTQLGDATVRRQIAAADLVLITIGANDFDTGSVDDDSCAAPELSCFQPALKAQQSQLADVLKQVRTALATRSATVLITGYWNVFLDGAVGATHGADYVRNSISLTRTENTQIAAAARAQNGTYVDLFTPFKGNSGAEDDTSLLAADGDHPNAAGHRRIADAVESAVASTRPAG
ncbi:hypothetical protein ACWT_6634 [Actinoplanes sp. SE50]|uniref:SGNH/GDSL hydrolase family protein n=1 Tax=unclassified Actinoplanes TaxID=2626549 RepID=UPI00023EC886|nr:MULTISPECIES: SGNH/GDSL hydrolase family protein [unclassified Actinoplanes]AEV87646.1 ypmR-like uncharacterized protein [Actinoplanes sp. SE50/110]ATO86049.1 hypothetical protein ACWT_6634 [Actinoplanes sp. SE50]SLM03463.1 GDSL-like Lipase/Acylhydrolase [Actinoplanes sp. SE50/110]